MSFPYAALTDWFLGAFAKYEERLVDSSCLSFRIQQLRSKWTDYNEVLSLRILRKSVVKIQVSQKSDKKTGTLHKDRLI